MKPISLKIDNARQTAVIARTLAEEVLMTKPSKKAMVIGLFGDLGAGKTTFVKAFMRGLGMRKKIISPTFVLMRSFPIKGPYHKIYHIDAYRVNEKAFGQLGLKDIINDPDNIVIIEWADRVKGILPADAISININHGAKHNERYFTFNRR
jgi:tRNA threonylcarbamoyladenosine biosynthesis protein TsaE